MLCGRRAVVLAASQLVDSAGAAVLLIVTRKDPEAFEGLRASVPQGPEVTGTAVLTPRL